MSGITSRKCAMAELNALPAGEFTERVGRIFEHSPWIAESVAGQRPFANSGALLAAMTNAVASADQEKQLALIRAHPDLAGRLAQQGLLTPESAREQAAAGLTAPETTGEIAELNAAYREKFRFPFVICARLNNAGSIVTAMRARLSNSPEAEIAAALAEISKIARLRLADIVEDEP